jgi:hypothetical protein
VNVIALVIVAALVVGNETVALIDTVAANHKNGRLRESARQHGPA